jgi:hypothetical protein
MLLLYRDTFKGKGGTAVKKIHCGQFKGGAEIQRWQKEIGNRVHEFDMQDCMSARLHNKN